ncbi:hypothetical protein Tco_0955203 [Tanacetum coccineum]|uniref:Uncharacterized protein n=1 Tax=Tanacetum coccineum TaxID=301880 RepID=A0ABQ5E6K0_9ASTR
MTRSSQGAGYASVGDKEKQICTISTVQEGRVLDIEPINAVPIRYAEPTKDGIYEEKEKWVRELSKALCSPYIKRKLSVTNKLQAIEKPVVESIFTGRYPVRYLYAMAALIKSLWLSFSYSGLLQEGFAEVRVEVKIMAIEGLSTGWPTYVHFRLPEPSCTDKTKITRKPSKKRENTDTRTEERARAGSQSQKVNLDQLSKSTLEDKTPKYSKSVPQVSKSFTNNP